MSSATSTETSGLGRAARHDPGFQVSHFFVLLSLMAATVAVVMARPSAPENLVLISLTIGAAGLAAVAFYRMIAPLIDPRAEQGREPLSARLRADLEREKALTLRSIKELEFDRAMGKVSDEDFDEMAGRLRARALGIMKQLEAGQSVYRQEIEKEIAARLAAVRPAANDRNAGPQTRQSPAGLKVRPTSASADDDRRAGPQTRQSPADLKVRPTSAPADDDRRAGLQTRHCVCGTANDPDAKFCKSCGAKLQGSAA